MVVPTLIILVPLDSPQAEVLAILVIDSMEPQVQEDLAAQAHGDTVLQEHLDMVLQVHLDMALLERGEDQEFLAHTDHMAALMDSRITETLAWVLLGTRNKPINVQFD
eukprot:TRINITY_DN262_c0_g1_i10.p5 TRINITY_DN262_c0_g1~~TRINITY_DN262_c0_g1_i10.p5  ORF type:complete len:108 (-),score=8.13 TRINITY_DN262_c0_g1_i10:103-426(-)